MPNIVRRFFEKIKISSETGLFAVGTNAGLAGDPHKMADNILKKNNLKLTSGFLIWMPENLTPKYGTWPGWFVKFVLRLSEKKIYRIVKEIKNKKRIREKSFWGINWYLTLLHNNIMSRLNKSLHPKDYFMTDSNCNGCSICAKICPVENIVIKK